MVRSPAAILALAMFGCGSSNGSVSIEIRTNYAPGVDFVEVRADLRNDDRTYGPLTLAAGEDDDYGVPVRVGSFPDVPGGTYTASVELRGAAGELVRMGIVRVSVEGDQIITIVVSTNCAGECLDAGFDDAGFDAGLDAGSDAGPPTLAADEACAAYAQARCEAVGRCCTSVPSGFDVTACERTYTGACNAILGPSVVRPGIDYDPAVAYVALERARALLLACDVAFAEWETGRDGLVAPITGTRAVGDDCSPVDELDAVQRFLAVLSCTSGVCRRRGPDDWRCDVLGPNGDACVLGFECEEGRCERAAGASVLERACGAGEILGSACFAGDECGSNVCHNETRMCAARTVDNFYCPAP